MTPAKRAVARDMYASGEHTVAAIAAVLEVSRASVYRHLAPSEDRDPPHAHRPRGAPSSP